MKARDNEGVNEAFEQLRQQGAVFVSSDDPEVVHQLRVSIRRLRVALRLFKGALAKTRRTQLRRDLRWLFARLGALRDLQVFRAACQERVIAGTPGAVGLDRRLQQHIRSQRKSVLALLSSARYARLVQGLSALLASPTLGAHARAWFADRLRKRHKRACQALQAAAKDPHSIHLARKELKKLRYACELSRKRFPEKRVQRYLQKMKLLQGELGAIVDLGVWQQLAREQCAARALQERLAAGFAQERALHLACIAEHIRHFAEIDPFWA